MPQPALICRPRVEAPRRLPQGASLLGVGNGGGNSDRHSVSNLVLNGKDVSEIVVVTVRPDVFAGGGFGEVGGKAGGSAGSSHGAFEYVAHTELTPDLLHIHCATLVGEAGIAGDDEQRRIARKRRDDLFDCAVGEIFLLWIATHVLEQQYRDRRLVGQRQWLGRGRKTFRHRELRVGSRPGGAPAGYISPPPG